MKKTFSSLFFSLLLFVLTAGLAIEHIQACTTAVVSGRFTPDGRPLIWKTRDSDDPNVALKYFTNGRYRAIALVNARDRDENKAWAGMNEEGFAIVNSFSYNLDVGDSTQCTPQDGAFLCRALLECATVDDFEQLLKSIVTPYCIESNYGVIDAYGNACYFEVSNYKVVKFDANNPATAPMGFLIRTNFSFSGSPEEGNGFARYHTAYDLLVDAITNKTTGCDYIIRNMTRCLKNSTSGEHLSAFAKKRSDETVIQPFFEFITHFSTTAGIVVHGVTPDESPLNTTLWAIIGFPLSSVAYPVWFNKSGILPEMLSPGSDGKSAMCSLSLKLKNRCFPMQSGNNINYINVTALLNADSTGIMQKLYPLEVQIADNAKKMTAVWKKTGQLPVESDILSFYRETDSLIRAGYNDMFRITASR